VDDYLPSMKKTEQADSIDESTVIEQKVLKEFQERLTVKPRLKTQLVDVSFEAQKPELAQLILNTLCETFIENNLETKTEATRKTAEWLSSRLQNLKINLVRSENNLQDYLNREHLVDLKGVMTLSGNEIEKILSVWRWHGKRALKLKVFTVKSLQATTQRNYYLKL